MKRSNAVDIRKLRLCACFEQTLGNDKIPLLNRQNERRIPVVVQLVDIRALFYKHLDNLCLTVAACVVQCGISVSVGVLVLRKSFHKLPQTRVACVIFGGIVVVIL